MMSRTLALAALLLTTSCGGGGGDASLQARSLGLPAEVGPVCGTSDLLGVEIGDIDGGAGAGCGVDDAVRLYAVNGVLLGNTARLNCRTARTFGTWVAETAQPAAKSLGARLESMRVAASYACRTRNGRSGARLSEHAKGNAIDISAITLGDGRVVDVQSGWGSGEFGRALSRMRKGACGPFGTVLGPGSDRFHDDHFHFDTAEHRSGPYCR